MFVQTERVTIKCVGPMEHTHIWVLYLNHILIQDMILMILSVAHDPKFNSIVSSSPEKKLSAGSHNETGYSM